MLCDCNNIYIELLEIYYLRKICVFVTSVFMISLYASSSYIYIYKGVFECSFRVYVCVDVVCDKVAGEDWFLC